jgi:hypothetical protein
MLPRIIEKYVPILSPYIANSLKDKIKLIGIS